MTTEQPRLVEPKYNPVPLVVIEGRGFGHSFTFTQHEGDYMRLAITNTLVWWWNDQPRHGQMQRLHQRIGGFQSAVPSEWVVKMPLTNTDIHNMQWALSKAANRYLEANPTGSRLASAFLDLNDRITEMFNLREGEG